MTRRFEVCGIGNALVDVEHTIEEGFLAARGIAKGHMTLVDEARIDALETELASEQAPIRSTMSGGSAANTVFAVQGFGGRGFYICRLGDDDPGRRFAEDMEGAGVGIAGRRGDGATGRCLTLITADAERTMTTCLGVCADLRPQDVDEAAVAASACLYMEGYLAAADAGSAAAVLAREIAETAGARTSISLSDPAMVANCRDGLTRMLGNGVDQLFCNEEEALDWTGADRLDIAAAELGDIAPHVNVTLGAAGSIAFAKGASTLVKGFPSAAVDTTGAGDIYAGACLHALGQGAAADDAARFANFAAAALVAKHGARLPNVADYAELARRFRGL